MRYATKWRVHVVLSGSPNQKPWTSAEHQSVLADLRQEKFMYFRYFLSVLFFDMVGVTGSIPVAPTIRCYLLRANLLHPAPTKLGLKAVQQYSISLSLISPQPESLSVANTKCSSSRKAPTKM